MVPAGTADGFACQQFVPAFAGALSDKQEKNHSKSKRKRSIMPRRHYVLNEVTNTSAFRLLRSWLSAGLLLCLVPKSEAAESRKVETRRQGDFSIEMRRCHAIEAVGDISVKGAPAMRDVYGGLIHENCRRSCPKARFQSTRKCRRLPFLMHDYTGDTYTTSMLLQRGNKIGRFRELDIGVCNGLPQNPEIVASRLQLSTLGDLHLTASEPQRQGFGQSTPVKYQGRNGRMPRTYSPNALVIWNIFDECTS